MNSIKILSEDLINKIAAGEVVERPASVVKELVENSVDAKSTDISINITDAGKRLISIIDNGIGMSKDDLLLSLERHATSKISTAGDLNNIYTLGFRGEALPSIAAISRLKIISSTKDSPCANCVEIEGGKIKKVYETAAPHGTSIEVKNLFYNVPARLKFLKSLTTEMGHIIDIVTNQTLANPGISFSLSHNNKIILNTERVTNLEGRIANLFGHMLLKELLPVEYPSSSLIFSNEPQTMNHEIHIKGYLSKPSSARSKKIHQYWLVNNRNIKNHLITHALYQAFAGLLPKEMHPMFILFIEIPPCLIDVNVHPAKLEIKFAEGSKIYELVKKAVQKALQQTDPLQAARVIGSDSYQEQRTNKNKERAFLKENPQAEGIHEAKTQYFNIPSEIVTSQTDTKENQEPKTKNQEQQENLQLEISVEDNYEKNYFESDKSNNLDLIPIGQLKNTFILFQGRDELVIMDQHAAHERVMYERIKKSLGQNRLEGQNLLIPYTIELSPKEALILEKYTPLFSELAFEIENFGQNSFVIKAVPVILEGNNIQKVIIEIIAELSDFEKTKAKEDIREPLIKRLACHSAIKANQPLDIREIDSLLIQWKNTELPHTCPHGRPILVKYKISKLMKDFGR
ncbi:MAG: DNA mismatch repair endonuclease MutL [bacterium]